MDMVRVDQDTDAVRAAVDPAADTARQFASAEELAVWAAPRPLSRLVALWNTFPGVVPVGAPHDVDHQHYGHSFYFAKQVDNARIL